MNIPINKAPGTVCFVAGRSGGHLIPALTLAERHKEQFPDDEIVFFSTNTTLDSRILQESKRKVIDEYTTFDLDNVPRRWFEYPLYALKVLKVFCYSFKFFYTRKPKKIVSTGGYISVPICYAAYLLRVYIELHEFNVIPGEAIKVMSKFANRVFISFGQASIQLRSVACSLVGYPVRFPPAMREWPQEVVVTGIELSSVRKTLFILGGSQGSIFINGLIREWILRNHEHHHLLQVIHQTGGQDPFNWKEFYNQLGIPAIVFDFSDHVEHYYLAADLIVNRAGAGTLFEILFFPRKSITIPLESATTDHQVANAEAIAAIYPHVFTLFKQPEVTKDPTALFSKMTEYLFFQPKPSYRTITRTFTRFT